MLVLFDQKSLKKEDSIFKPTNEERERMKAFEHERGLAFDKHYRFGTAAEPSIVLDDFLFLGNMQHASNRDLLQRFQISTLTHHCFI